MKILLEVTPSYQIPIEVDENDILYDVLYRKGPFSSLVKNSELAIGETSVSPFLTIKRQNIVENDVLKLRRKLYNGFREKDSTNKQPPQFAFGTVFSGIIDEMSRLRDLMYNNAELQRYSQPVHCIDSEEEAAPNRAGETCIVQAKDLTDSPLPVPWATTSDYASDETEQMRVDAFLCKNLEEIGKASAGEVITMLLEQDWEW